MSPSSRRSLHRLPRRGFTLLEVGIVLVMLAALATLVITHVGGADAQADQLLREERVRQLREALLRFRQDTGYFPGEGLFSVHASDGVAIPGMGPNLPFTAHPQWQEWLESPANVLMLVRAPTTNLDSTDPYDWILQGQAAELATWDPERQRGWKGPYLKQGSYAWIRISRHLEADGSGTPVVPALAPPGDLLPFMPAVFDSELPELEPLGAMPETLEWWSDPPQLPGAARLDRQPGRPLYVFNRSSTGGPQGGLSLARIVSCGADGAYQPHAISPASASDPLYQDWTLRPAAPDLSQEPIPGPYSDDFGLFLTR